MRSLKLSPIMRLKWEVLKKILPRLLQGIILEGQNIDQLIGMNKELARKADVSKNV